MLYKRLASNLDIDCDVSLRSVMVYMITFDYVLNDNRKLQNQMNSKNKYCLTNGINFDYRGDTMNSFKQIVDCYLKFLKSNSKYKEEYFIEVKKFLELNHTVGNFIPVPFKSFGNKKYASFNQKRNLKLGDYWDLTIYYIYNWYISEDKKYLIKLDENLSVFDTIDYVAKGDIRLKIRDILGAFMFGGEASDKKVKVLSGGERSRLAMIKLLLEPVNFLILDEPTNHLDMRSKDVLKEAIKEFDGTVIVVSHDREFLDGLVTKVYEFGGGVVKEHIGGIYDFLQKKKIESLNELQLSASPTMSATKKEELETVSENKLSYEAQKELNKKIRKLEKRIADCEQKIEKLETEIGEVEADMATPEGASDMALYEKHQKLKKDLDQTVEEWETVSMELEEMQGS